MQISEYTEVGYAEDGRLAIDIDGDNLLRFTHAHQVMAGAGYARSQVESRGHRLPCLSNLPLVFNPTQVDRRPARCQTRSERARQRSQYFETLLSSNPASTRDQPFRVA